MMKLAREYQTDVVVVGAGAAGIRAALEAAGRGSQVILTNKGPVAKSGITLVAGGGIQAPFFPDDSPEQFFADVIEGGHEIADQNLVWALVNEAQQRILDMESYGVKFLKNEKGDFELSQFPGHSYPRNIKFAGGGIGIMAPFKQQCFKHPNITVLEDFVVTALVSGDGAVAGVMGIDLKTGELALLRAGAVVMATGGCQWIWQINDCPADATGDGLALALRAGAELVDMEMMLFYPSVIVWPPAAQGAFVHYEYLDGKRLDGNVFDKHGEAILPKPMPSRDQSMRLMFEAIEEGRGTEHHGLHWYVADSPKGAEFVKKYLNKAQYHYIRKQGIDPVSERIEVAPGAHYQLGGIFIDEKTNSTLPGLFATPECAGNYEGANRLSGSALIGTQVFGARAGQFAHEWAAKNAGEASQSSIEQETERIAAMVDKKGGSADAGSHIMAMISTLRQQAQKHIGVKREPAGLTDFMATCAQIKKELDTIKVPAHGAFNQLLLDFLQLQSMVEVAEVVAGSALLRNESRGHHFRVDFPEKDNDNWIKHTAVRFDQGKLDFMPKEIIESNSGK